MRGKWAGSVQSAGNPGDRHPHQDRAHPERRPHEIAITFQRRSVHPQVPPNLVELLQIVRRHATAAGHDSDCTLAGGTARRLARRPRPKSGASCHRDLRLRIHKAGQIGARARSIRALAKAAVLCLRVSCKFPNITDLYRPSHADLIEAEQDVVLCGRFPKNGTTARTGGLACGLRGLTLLFSSGLTLEN